MTCKARLRIYNGNAFDRSNCHISSKLLSDLALSVIAIVSLGMAGCAAGPDYHAPTVESLAVPRQYSVPLLLPADGQADWWRRFDDPELARLVDEGTRANFDIAAAFARLRQAREGVVQARAGLLPTVSANAGASRSGIVSGPGAMANALSLGVDAAWQIDLFGGLARGLESARADAAASGYDYGAVTIAMQGEIARTYLLVRLQQALRENAVQSLSNQDDNLQIARWRNQAGLASGLDVEQARAQRAQTAATVPQLEAARDQDVALIGVLIGREPGALRAELATVAPLPAVIPAVAVGIPADLLRRRPDVRSAERALASATARIGVARAQLLPALSLTGNLGTSAPNATGLFDAFTGGAFASLAQTIFAGGRLRSQVRAQQAATDAAQANYRKSVLTSLEDVENALVALRAAEQRQRDYGDAVDGAQGAAILARAQYRSGLIDFATLLITENQLLAARNSLVQARYDRAVASVQLFAALGGGWDDRVPATTDHSGSTP